MKTAIAAGLFCVSLGLFPVLTSAAETADDAQAKLTENQRQLQVKEAEIAELSRKIKELQGQRDSAAVEADVINTQLQRLNNQLAKAELELKKTQLNIQHVTAESQATAQSIENLEQGIMGKRQQLRSLFRQLYEKEQEPWLAIFLRSGSVSEALAERSAYEKLQTETAASVAEFQGQMKQLQDRQANLDQQQADLAKLSGLLESQQAEIAANRGQQKQFLAAKRSEQLKFENLLAEARQARQEVEQDAYTLKGAGVQLTFTAANDMAKFAGKLTGVRPALLLAVLKVESNLGNNIGGGKFPEDMQPASREAFVRLTQKLKLDPATTPISARPRNYSGWGGAMGPAQIMPQTWETIEPRLSSLMSKPNPNPYELTDALVATAILLADKGASQAAQEYEAVNRYLAGPNWQRFTWYGDRVLAVAKEYEQQGI